MERKPVTSSMIREVGYEDATLEIDFHKGGTYQYSGVPQEEYDSLMSADSCGKYFLANIKDKYPTTKL